MKKINSKHKLLLALPFFFILLLLAGVLIWYLGIYCPVTYEALPPAESTESLPNPGMGWYKLYGYGLSDEKDITREDILNALQEDTDTRLSLLQINLKQYKNGPVSDKALAQLDTILDTYTTSGKSLILRFTYDWDGRAEETEPEELDTVLHHMEQVSAFVNPYAKHIYTIQGIFVGAYGEMHGSRHMDTDSMYRLMKQLADATDPSIFLAVRTPAHLRAITERDETLSGRIGLYNDGMLSSESDSGTYLEPSESNEGSPAQKKTRREELTFQETLCLTVPNGGEVITDNPLNDLKNAITDLRRMHVSYLNMGYDPKVLDKWKSSVYTGDDIFQGSSGYDYMTAHLGYRYVLQSSDLAFDTFRDEQAVYTLTVKNVGFSSSYQDFDLYLTLTHQETGESLELKADTSTRKWLPGKLVTIAISLDVRNISDGSYAVSTRMCTKDGEQVLFANNDGTDGSYFLGTLVIGE